MEEISKEDKNMEQALRFMERFVNDEEVRNLYDKINDVEYYARKEGHESGLAEGKIEGEKFGRKAEKLEMAKNMLKKSIPLNDIIEITSLTKNEIEALL